MVMFVTKSAKLVDAIINHPDVRPTMEPGDHRLSSAEVLSNPQNVVYAGEQGVIVFQYLRPGEYQGHIGFLQAGRGRPALAAGRYCLDDLFTHFDARVVLAAVPLQLRPARMLCRLLGFTPKAVDAEREWMLYEGGSDGRLN